MESLKNAHRYGNRALYIKKQSIEIAGHNLYAYVVVDPKARGEKSTKYILEALDDKKNVLTDYDLAKKGVSILISSTDILEDELLPLYYERQYAEQVFGYLKEDLSLLPLRVHSETTFRGYIFITFLALIAYVEVKKNITNQFQFDQILINLRNLKSKVYGDEVIISERTKMQRQILECLQVTLPS
jgi:transposase